MKRVLPLLAIVLSVFMLFGCAKREMIGCTYLEGDACNKEKIEVADDEVAVVKEATDEATEVVAVVEKAKDDVEATEEVVTEVLPEEVKEAISESVWVKYMIQPNDYLMKIALQEYGIVTMWREIWDWNKDLVGDNPDLIYPFDELSLLKDGAEVAKEVALEDYTVKEGETLWCIAKKLYGNSYAWIVLLRDNMEVLGDDYNSLTPGTVLKVRAEL